MKLENFTWREMNSTGGIGVAYRKHLKTFTERAVFAEMLKVVQGGHLGIPPIDGIQLILICRGDGEVNGTKTVKESAFRLDPGQKVTIVSISC